MLYAILTRSVIFYALRKKHLDTSKTMFGQKFKYFLTDCRGACRFVVVIVEHITSINPAFACNFNTCSMKTTGFVAIRVQNSDNKMRNYALFHFDMFLLYQQTNVTYKGCGLFQKVLVAIEMFK